MSATTDELQCPHQRLGRFCEEHWSWLCSVGQGKCQEDNDCPKGGPRPRETSDA